MPVNELPKYQLNRTQVLISLVFLIAMVGLIGTIQTVGPEIESAIFSKRKQLAVALTSAIGKASF